MSNREACLRLADALEVGQSEEWIASKRFLDDMRELEEHRREERKVKEVALIE